MLFEEYNKSGSNDPVVKTEQISQAEKAKPKESTGKTLVLDGNVDMVAPAEPDVIKPKKMKPVQVVDTAVTNQNTPIYSSIDLESITNK